MKVLLLGYGKAPVRFKYMSNYCENYWQNDGEHELLTFGYSEGADILLRPEDDFSTVVNSLPPGWVPDYCLLREVEWNMLPKGIETAPFPVVTLTFDWDYDVALARAFVEASDLIISVSDAECSLLKLLGARITAVINPMGIMREFFAPEPKKQSERKYDILYTTFIDDVHHLDRSIIMRMLCLLSDKYSVHIPDQVRGYDEYLGLLRDSRLVLSHHRYGSMSGRIFEAGAQGTVVLETGEEVKKYFEPGREFIPVTAQNIVSQAGKYLADMNTLQEMSDRVYRKVTERYEARTRFMALLDFIGRNLRGRKFFRAAGRLSAAEAGNRRGEVYYYQYFKGISGEGFLNIDRKKVLELAAEGFDSAKAADPSPEFMTNAAVAGMTINFIYNGHAFRMEQGAVTAAALKQVISMYPDYAMAYYYLGMLHFRVGSFDEAAVALLEALRVFRDNSSRIDPWCVPERDYPLSIQLLRKSMNYNQMLYLKGNTADALTNIRKLYQAVILFNLAVIEDSKGNICQAMDHLLEAHRLHPDSGIIAMRAAKRLAELGRREESVELYRRAAALLPFNLELIMELIKVLRMYGRTGEMNSEIRNALRIIRTVGHLRHRARELMDLISAIESSVRGTDCLHDSLRETMLAGWAGVFYKCLDQNPEDHRIVRRIVEIWQELGRADKVLEVLENYVDLMRKKGTSGNELIRDIPRILEDLKADADLRQNAVSERARGIASLLDVHARAEGVRVT